MRRTVTFALVAAALVGLAAFLAAAPFTRSSLWLSVLSDAQIAAALRDWMRNPSPAEWLNEGENRCKSPH